MASRNFQARKRICWTRLRRSVVERTLFSGDTHRLERRPARFFVSPTTKSVFQFVRDGHNVAAQPSNVLGGSLRDRHLSCGEYSPIQRRLRFCTIASSTAAHSVRVVADLLERSLSVSPANASSAGITDGIGDKHQQGVGVRVLTNILRSRRFLFVGATSEERFTRARKNT